MSKSPLLSVITFINPARDPAMNYLSAGIILNGGELPLQPYIMAYCTAIVSHRSSIGIQSDHIPNTLNRWTTYQIVTRW